MMQMFCIAASLLNKFGVKINRNNALQIINVIREQFLLYNNLLLLLLFYNLCTHRDLSDFINTMNMNRSVFISLV